MRIIEAIEKTGKWIAHLCISLIGLTILIGTPIVGIWASIWIGKEATILSKEYVPWAWMGVVIFFGVPLLLIFYLTLYVWPEVFAAIQRALKALLP